MTADPRQQQAAMEELQRQFAVQAEQLQDLQRRAAEVAAAPRVPAAVPREVTDNLSEMVNEIRRQKDTIEERTTLVETATVPSGMKQYNKLDEQSGSTAECGWCTRRVPLKYGNVVHSNLRHLDAGVRSMRDTFICVTCQRYYLFSHAWEHHHVA